MWRDNYTDWIVLGSVCSPSPLRADLLDADAYRAALRGLPHADRTFDNGAARHTVAIGGRKR